MIDRTPKPLKVGDRVRIGIGGHSIWTVDSRVGVRWKIVNQHHMPRYFHIDHVDQLRRVNGVPIEQRTSKERSCDSPHALALNDKVRYAYPSRRPCRTMTMWTVVYLDDHAIELATAKSRRYLTWREVEHGKIVRPNGRPIVMPDGTHV